MKTVNDIKISEASEEHLKYAEEICQVIYESSLERATGIAKREPAYIRKKISEGKAVIALSESDKFIGFCYIESWGAMKNFVANSGLIVAPAYRGLGVGKLIKQAVFELSLKRFPDAKLFGITTSPAVMKINYSLGYRPVTFAQLTDDDEFWAGCKSCRNFDILERTSRKYCLCTAMLYDHEEKKIEKEKEKGKETVYEEKSRISL
jgi:GNAT superfamily N-acetyltransferase